MASLSRLYLYYTHSIQTHFGFLYVNYLCFSFSEIYHYFHSRRNFSPQYI